MPRKRLLSPAIAQIVLPHAIKYQLQVFVQEGYLVTRQRRGIGPPLPPEPPRGIAPRPPETEPPRPTYAAYQDYWHPVFNEVAVARSGIAPGELDAWLAGADHDALTHPLYAPLCLRWGANAEGVWVQQYQLPAVEVQRQVLFEPYWDAPAGQTHYELADPEEKHLPLTEALRARGLLRVYPLPPNTLAVREILYATDWAALQQFLATVRMVPVLVQYVTRYYVCLCKKPGAPAWIENYALRSEAEARYAEFPANPIYDAYLTEEYPRLEIGEVTLLGEWPVDSAANAEKVLFKSAHRKKALPG